eukprot:gene27354-33696_t
MIRPSRLSVLQDFFRAVTVEDLSLAFQLEPAEDPDLLVPALGRHYSAVWAHEDAGIDEDVPLSIANRRTALSLPRTDSASSVRIPYLDIVLYPDSTKTSHPCPDPAVAHVTQALPFRQEALAGPSAAVRGEGEPKAEASSEGGKSLLMDDLAAPGCEEEAMCVVCGNGDSEAPNQMVYCERCGLWVHQGCYSIAEIPEAEWYCWPCRQQLHDPSLPVLDDIECVLCPVRRGAFKRLQ